MTDTLKAGLVAALAIAAAQLPADPAHARKAHDHHRHHAHAAGHAHARFAGTTDIRECGKLAPDKRDRCISLSRPVSGAAIYAHHRSIKERTEASVARIGAKVGAAATAAAAGAKLAVARDGTTDIMACAKIAPELRDQCISRSRPVTGAALTKQATPHSGKAAPIKTSAATAPAATAPAAKAAAAGAGLTTLKGLVAKNGTTDVRDCGKVDPGLRDRCISLSRPVKGVGLLSGVVKASAGDPALEQAAKEAAVRAVKAIRNVFAKDGTTDIRDCGKVDPSLRDRCISASRPVRGAQLLQRS